MSTRSLLKLLFIPKLVSIKEDVLPFEKLQGCDILLRPDMCSTREVMGINFEFPTAFDKAQFAAGQKLPISGMVTSGMAQVLEFVVLQVEELHKMHEGWPHSADMLASGQIQVMVMFCERWNPYYNNYYRSISQCGSY